MNLGKAPKEAEPPNVESRDFIAGSNMVASRQFVKQVGLMTEDYFLYYEEVDWAARRGDLPLVLCPEAEVIHHAGTAIGSPTLTRRGSPFANYFNYRNRMRFMYRLRPWALPIAWFLSMLRVGRLFVNGAGDEAWAALRRVNDLSPPTAVRDWILPADRRRAFGPRERTR